MKETKEGAVIWNGGIHVVEDSCDNELGWEKGGV